MNLLDKAEKLAITAALKQQANQTMTKGVEESSTTTGAAKQIGEGVFSLKLGDRHIYLIAKLGCTLCDCDRKRSLSRPF